MKTIHLIPTEKPSRLFIIDGKLYNYHKPQQGDGVNEINQNIYITSDEELVLGGYHFNSKYGDEPQKTNQRDIDSKKYWEEEDYYITKIILTTDLDLIKDNVQAIDNEFLEWFVKNPSCESVEVEKESICARCHSNDVDECWSAKECSDGKYDKIRYKIIIPKEEPKQETLEEAAFHYSKNKINKNTSLLDFTKGAKWQAERMFSEEDMRNAFDSAREFNSLDGVVDVHIVLPMGGDMSDLQPLHFTFDDWFEQFSKLKNG